MKRISAKIYCMQNATAENDLTAARKVVTGITAVKGQTRLLKKGIPLERMNVIDLS